MEEQKKHLYVRSTIETDEEEEQEEEEDYEEKDIEDEICVSSWNMKQGICTVRLLARLGSLSGRCSHVSRDSKIGTETVQLPRSDEVSLRMKKNEMWQFP